MQSVRLPFLTGQLPPFPLSRIWFHQMSDSRIAIVIPVYNVERYIAECLDSILRQTHSDFVAFLVDDGSTDRSGMICDEYARRDKRFRVIHQTNSGVSSARNAALDAIEKDGSFDFIAFIDSDDFVSPVFLSEMASAILREKVDYALCNTITFKDGETPVERKFRVPYTRLNKDNILEQYLGLNDWRKYKSKKKSIFNKVFSAPLLQDLRFDTRMRTGEDVRYFAMVSSRMSSAVMVDRPLYFYRVRAGSLMTSRAPEIPASQTGKPVPAEKTVSPDDEGGTDLGLDTIRLFMNQASDDSHLYWSIHGQLIDALWKRLKNAYIANMPYEIDRCKKQLLREMHPLRHLSIRHYRMRLLLALGDSFMKKYAIDRKK